MKASPITTNTECEEQPNFYSSWSASLLLGHLSTLLKKLQYVPLVIQVGQRVQSLREILRGDRYLIGSILCVAAPLSSVAYQLIDPLYNYSPDWILVSPHYYLMAIGQHLQTLLLCLAIFLVVPYRFKVKYLVIVWPVFDAVTRIIHISFFVTTNEDFHTPSWIAIASSLLVVPTLLALSDYWLEKYHHKRRGNICRAKGLLDAPIDPAVKVEKMKVVIDECADYYLR